MATAAPNSAEQGQDLSVFAKKTPTPTPTACVAVTSATIAATGGTAGFNAQGNFKTTNKQQIKYRDVTGQANWFPTNSALSYQGNGLFLGMTDGCSCIGASAGGFLSQSVTITVGPPPTIPCSCPQVATPTPSP
ncbi:MAG: hypothetical protein ACREQN_00735 [Candidatus Binataceae bacterium]